MRLQDKFKNVFSYSAGMEKWCKDFYEYFSGKKIEYTFISDFAIADWYNEKSVIETYGRVKKSWLNDYEAFTNVVIALNLLSHAHEQLRKQGVEDREKFVKLYSDLYYKANDLFYEHYKDNEEATNYYFEMTD